MLLFIGGNFGNWGGNGNFNTSHVTVYLVQTEIMQMQNTNFNTSHVTVYP